MPTISVAALTNDTYYEGSTAYYNAYAVEVIDFADVPTPTCKRSSTISTGGAYAEVTNNISWEVLGQFANQTPAKLRSTGLKIKAYFNSSPTAGGIYPGDVIFPTIDIPDNVEITSIQIQFTETVFNDYDMGVSMFYVGDAYVVVTYNLVTRTEQVFFNGITKPTDITVRVSGVVKNVLEVHVQSSGVVKKVWSR